MRYGFSTAAAFLLASLSIAAPASAADADCAALTCRPNGQPYVDADGSVVVLPGEEFSLLLTVANGKITKMTYSPDASETAPGVRVSFSTESVVMLSVNNPLELTLKYDAFMDFGDGQLHATSSCPVMPKMGGFEMWGDPIKRLVLKNLRLLPADAPMVCN